MKTASRSRPWRIALGGKRWFASGGSFVYADMGDAKIDNPTLLRDDYEDNRIFSFALNKRYTF